MQICFTINKTDRYTKFSYYSFITSKLIVCEGIFHRTSELLVEVCTYEVEQSTDLCLRHFLLIHCSIFLPLGGVMIFCYSRLFASMNRQMEPSSSTDSSHCHDITASERRVQNFKKVQMNVIQTCALLCLFFILTYAFLFVSDTLIIFGVFGFDDNIWNASFISLLLNSCINPFIYTIRLVHL